MISFPILKDHEVGFYSGDVPENLLKEAKEKGFDQDSNPYNKLFNTLFFKGGRLPNYKADVSMEDRKNGLRYLRALMMSFKPRHEHKEAVCAYILSELVDEPVEK